MSKLIRYFVSLILICFNVTSKAQHNTYQFENFSTTQGLPQYPINQILEDHFGFLWFATNAGLFRYDGYNLMRYLHNVHDSTSISSPGINHIVEDQNGQIWIATLYGINLLDRRTGTFSKYYPYPNDLSAKSNNFIDHLFVDSKNRLFALGATTLYLFDQESSEFKIIKDRKGSIHKQDINAMAETGDGSLWCTAETGLLRINPGKLIFEFVQLDTKNTGELTTGITAIAKEDDSKLWLNTSRGLILFDTEDLSVKEDLLPSEFRLKEINALAKIKNGDLLIGFENHGLGVLSTADDYQHYSHSDDRFNSLQNNNISCIVEDQFDNIWLGTTNGISKISTENKGFNLLQNKRGPDLQVNNINRVYKDRQGTIWMNTELGLYKRPKSTDVGQAVLIDELFETVPKADYFHEDGDGNLYVSFQNNGLWLKSKTSSSFKKIFIGNDLDNAHVYKILEDDKNTNILWLGTSIGLCKWDTVKNEYQIYKALDQYPALKSNRISVLESYGDEIWLYYTYNNSIGRFDKNTGKFELIDAPADDQYMLEGVFRDMAVSPDNKVWFATNFGLSQYDSKDKTFEIFTQKQGLLNNNINAVIIDNSNQIWAIGQQFLAKFDAKSNTFTSYDEAETVKKFFSRSAHLAEDGQILIGCLNGVFAFYPDSIKSDNISPNVILTNFKVRDTIFLLEEAFENVTSIKLKHDQNDISFEFSGINYVDPMAIQYRCLLEGYDKNWRYLGNDHHVSYTNLNSGEFKFRLAASNADGLWNEKELHIDILISPPFTQTYWFKALIILFIASMIYVLVRSRQKRIQLNTQKEFAEKSAAYKTQFLADVSHEIRTPMNAIIGLSKLTLETNLDKSQTKFVSAIQDSSKNLLTIINDLLDHTKLEAGKFTFVKKAFDLSDITRMLTNTFTYIADEKGIIFDINVEQGITQKLIGDPTRLNQILTNLLGNAFKFTEKGLVSLNINKQEDSQQKVNLRFEVKDTGIGIPKDKLASIFENFSQVDGAVNKGMEGTGLGLSIAQQMVEKQGGQLYIDSQLGKGTKLWFDLSFEKNNFKNSGPAKAQITQRLDQLDVLVVEDTYFNQMLVVEILKKHIKNPKIVIAENGKVALEKLNQFAFDIILMDVKMQVMDGFEATKLIRRLEDKGKQNIPILAVTASAVPEQLMKCKAAGMNDYVTKPIDENELIEKMHALVRKGNK